jgi:hypothetical protein
MEENELAGLFAKVSRLNEKKHRYLTESDWSRERLKTFKRKALGPCGSQSIKSLDEMAQLLLDTGIAKSLDEGRELTPSLDGARVPYEVFSYLCFDEVRDTNKNKAYRIEIWTPACI